MNGPTFDYQPLSANSKEIRLALIQPEIDSPDINCSLEHAFLGERPPYEALSYNWGDPSDTVDIKLNGHPFPVTRNLATSLQYLRKDTAVTKLWIDAISINQKDFQEKNSQLLQMKEIYETANKIVIWLGEESDDSNLAMKAMPELAQMAMIPPGPWLEKILRQPFDVKPLNALQSFLNRPWWTRA